MSEEVLVSRTKLVMAVAIFVVGLDSSVLRATTIRIPNDQPTIQAGIDASSNGDTVLVSLGTYSESIDFKGKRIVVGSIYILSGDTSCISGTVIRGNSGGPVVTFMSNEDSLSVLVGFTITGGLNGIYCLNSSPTVIHTFITRNISSTFGGGIYCSNSCPIIMDSRIVNNNAKYDGGGIYCLNSRPKLTGMVVSDNISYGGNGGGLCLIGNSSAIVRSTQIMNNLAGWYGGGIACDSSDPLIESSVIGGNTSQAYFGGGIYCNYYSMPTLANVSITNNKVCESVGTGSGGGGIRSRQNSNPFLSNVTIAKNTAAVAGGGIYVDDYSTITLDSLKRCNIYLNDGSVGYDIYSYTNKLRVVVDTFTVLKPSNMQTYPIANFAFSILHAKLSQDLSTLFVSPNGDNGNSGLSWAEALKTIKFAHTIISGSAQHPATIYIDSGTYSATTNGEQFMISLKNYISLKGRGVNKTILRGNGESNVLEIGTMGDTIEDLTITNYGQGGWSQSGIYCVVSSVVFKNVIIRDCHSAYGAAIFSSSSNITMINALLSSNSSDYYGGAVRDYGSTYNLINVTIANNTAKQLGGAFFSDGGTINLVNSIVWNNSPDQIVSSSSIAIAYSDIKNGQAGIVINGNGSILWIQGTNMDCDPQFVDGFHLGDNSACVGAGIKGIQLNGTWLNSPNQDVEKNPRPVSAPSFPDLGAFENQLDHPLLVIEKKGGAPNQFTLCQNYPNPFNPSTNISFSLPSSSFVTLRVFDVLGKEVAVLVSQELRAGAYSRIWTPTGFASGIYFYRLQAGNHIAMKKLLLLK